MSAEDLSGFNSEESAASNNNSFSNAILYGSVGKLSSHAIDATDATPAQSGHGKHSGFSRRERQSVDNTQSSLGIDKIANSHFIDTANTSNPYRLDITHDKPLHSSVDMMDFVGAVSVDERLEKSARPFSSQLKMIDAPIGGKRRAASCDLSSKPGTVSVDNPLSKVTVDRVKPAISGRYGIKKSSFSRRNSFSMIPGDDIAEGVSPVFSGGVGDTVSDVSSKIVAVIKIAREAAKKEIIRSVASLLLPVILIVFILYAVISTIGGAVLAPVAISNLTAYPSAEEDITSSTYDATNYCEDLKEYIEGIPGESEWGHIDEFKYIPSLSAILSEIDYDGWELQAYLNAKFKKYISADVAAEIQSIMDEMFVLNLREIEETRYRTNSDGVEESYEYYILEISLTKTELEAVVTSRMDDEQKIMYDLYMTEDLYGTQQGICNPFDFDWRSVVTCYYGNRYIDGEADFHTGMDLAWGGCTGTPIYAGVTGTVTNITTTFPYGNRVDITSSDGTILVRYAHMLDGSVSVSMGQPVKAGITKIGGVGSTGWSSGPHLHIEIIKNGTRLDPRYVLSYGKRGIS